MITKTDREHLSEHFTLYELVRSGAAMDLGLDNHPTPKQTEALRALCANVLEPLRRRFGPIVVSSGYRTARVNQAVGGVPGSQHTRGEAADIVAGSTERARAMAHWAERELDFDQLIIEPLDSPTPRWIHLSYSATRRNRHHVIHPI